MAKKKKKSGVKSSISSSSGSRKRPASSGNSRSSARTSSSPKKSTSKPRPKPSSSPRTITSRIQTPASSKSKSTSGQSKGSSGSSHSGAGTSFSTRNVSAGMPDMTDRVSALQSRWQSVATMMALTALYQSLEDTGSNVNDLAQDLNNLRARGYRFGRDWEERVAAIQDSWPQQRMSASQQIEEQQNILKNAGRDVESLVRRASSNYSLIDNAESRIQSLENNVNTAKSRIGGIFDNTQNDIWELQRQFQEAKTLLDAIENASFDFYPDEHGVAICKAQWISDHQEPEGLLYLTDKRLIFEQHEEKATKKILFITTEKELLQELLWEAPIGAVEELEAEDKKGFLSRKELLTLRFSERTRDLPSDATLQLKGADNETWRRLIRRVKSGQIESDRFGAPPPVEALAAEIEAEETASDKELPTKCPSCGAQLPAIFKGMQQVSCSYCGTIINI